MWMWMSSHVESETGQLLGCAKWSNQIANFEHFHTNRLQIGFDSISDEKSSLMHIFCRGCLQKWWMNRLILSWEYYVSLTGTVRYKMYMLIYFIFVESTVKFWLNHICLDTSYRQYFSFKRNSSRTQSLPSDSNSWNKCEGEGMPKEWSKTHQSTC